MKLIKKYLLIFSLMLCLVDGHAQLFHGDTQIGIGYYHAGSYSKERPIFGLHQRFEYGFINSDVGFLKRLRVGAGLGFQIFPNALGVPLSFSPRFMFKESDEGLYLRQEVGRYVRFSDVFIKSSFYAPIIGYTFKGKEYSNLFTELGGLYLWDGFGGKSLSLTVAFGFRYVL